jgi:hypothetical protein
MFNDLVMTVGNREGQISSVEGIQDVLDYFHFLETRPPHSENCISCENGFAGIWTHTLVLDQKTYDHLAENFSFYWDGDATNVNEDIPEWEHPVYLYFRSI